MEEWREKWELEGWGKAKCKEKGWEGRSDQGNGGRKRVVEGGRNKEEKGGGQKREEWEFKEEGMREERGGGIGKKVWKWTRREKELGRVEMGKEERESRG